MGPVGRFNRTGHSGADRSIRPLSQPKPTALPAGTRAMIHARLPASRKSTAIPAVRQGAEPGLVSGSAASTTVTVVRLAEVHASPRAFRDHRLGHPDKTPYTRGMGDIMSPAKRSALMSRIRGKNTDPEKAVFAAMRSQGLRFDRHTKGLPGRPDATFPKARLVVFVDGDFWHGWRFPCWEWRLTPFWREKIGANRARDQRNFRRLRRRGWKVVRVWEHQVERDIDAVLERVVRALAESHSGRPSEKPAPPAPRRPRGRGRSGSGATAVPRAG